MKFTTGYLIGNFEQHFDTLYTPEEIRNDYDLAHFTALTMPISAPPLHAFYVATTPTTPETYTIAAHVAPSHDEQGQYLLDTYPYLTRLPLSPLNQPAPGPASASAPI